MKNTIEKILNRNPLSIDEFVEFITVYSDLSGIKNTTPEHIQSVLNLIMHGMLDIQYAAKRCANLLNINIMTISDSNGNLIKTIVT